MIPRDDTLIIVICLEAPLALLQMGPMIIVGSEPLGTAHKIITAIWPGIKSQVGGFQDISQSYQINRKHKGGFVLPLFSVNTFFVTYEINMA